MRKFIRCSLPIGFGFLLGFSTFQVMANEVLTRPQLADNAKSGEVIPLSSVEIAKKLANPIADMISVPFQYNYSRGVGKNQTGSEQTLVFQPVIPFNLGGGDAFIFRPIVTSAHLISGTGFNGYGVANVTIESFYAPNTGSSWIWGVGPYLSSPSGNSGYFGSQQTGAGVTAVVLNRHGPWTYGILGFQSWSVGGNPTFGTQNNLYGQPFVSYTNSSAWSFMLQSQAQYNYDSHRTNNPLYFGISKLEVFGNQPVQFGIGPTYYLSNTPGGPSGWGGRAVISFVFPK
ncbi:hypothetical protein [Polynucleobacter sp. AP-Titi-500A-B4]|uniref:hypothetical protein n=1 Tax=Polynucleobacter sp. AP-Titi-500A-B4 TaxID=2576923 RepID=UPI001BFD0430|nr:hypothetical protein [Polynucleobacter sp. AP-Titi-500A-B4]QWE12117.1 transporter [Polynucleobacter sp. AP-Titi-500A-B4]